MAKEYAEPFYKSTSWRKTRNSYFIKQCGLCERCGNSGKIVHHKIYITPKNINEPSITLNWDNLELLCQDCHNKEHISSDNIDKSLMFDTEGNIVQKYTIAPISK